MNARQFDVANAIRAGLNGITSAQDIARRLGYRPSREGILPVTSSLRAMERAGLVGRLPPEDQWCVAKWFLMPKAKLMLERSK